MRYYGLLLILLGLPAASYAIEPYTCRNGAFPTYTEFSPAEIVAATGEQVHARDDGEGCPEQAKCLKKGYLINGDKVLTAHPAEGWVCIYYFGKKSSYTGWVPQTNVKTIPFFQSPEINDWLGKWESIGSTDNVIVESAPAGMLKITGRANWYGGKNTYGDDIVHFGGVNGVAAPAGNKLIVKEGDDEYDCVVNFELVGPYLVSTDNSNCGGVNVRFNNIYRRTP